MRLCSLDGIHIEILKGEWICEIFLVWRIVIL